MNVFRNTESSVTDGDFDDVERSIGRRLPASLRRHYLMFNGGQPTLATFPGDETSEEAEVAVFFPIRFNARVDDLRRTLLDGKYHHMVEKNVIPAELLPFAGDWGGNFFCLNLDTGDVVFYATDAFDPDLPIEQNQKNAQRRLCSSFEEFLGALTASELEA